MREIKAVVRKERLADLLRSLQNAGASRFTVSRVHVLGAGVDSTDVEVTNIRTGGTGELALL